MNNTKTIAEIFNNLNDVQKEVAYEIIGQALDLGYYDREALVMFNKEESIVINYLLHCAMTMYMKGE